MERIFVSVIEMRVIPKPEEGSRAIFQTNNNEDDFVFFKLNGENDYICSRCKKIICKNANRSQIKNFVFLCPRCKSYIEVKGI